MFLREKETEALCLITTQGAIVDLSERQGYHPSMKEVLPRQDWDSAPGLTKSNFLSVFAPMKE